jgi:protein ImuB
VRFSPAVAIDGTDGLFLDIRASDHLWGGEAAMLDDLLARLARWGVPARAAIADTPGAAWALARYGDDRHDRPARRPGAAARGPAGRRPAPGRRRRGPAAAPGFVPRRPAASPCRAPSWPSGSAWPVTLRIDQALGAAARP